MSEELSFGRWLRRRRRALDLTQKALAIQVGCAEITIRRMEADEYKPSKELAFVLFEKLGILEPERDQWVRFARGVAELPEKKSDLSTGNQRTNLPLSLTSFIGRETEQAEITNLLENNRLVTLTGVGGIGKTRLSLQVASRLSDEFPDGIWLVEFAPLSDPALVGQVVVKTLGLINQGNRPPQNTLIDYLKAKKVFLVFDNCEHLIQACAELTAELLQACLGLKILVTSREALGIDGETVYLVPSLTTPDAFHTPLENLLNYESIQLFLERAQSALPGYKLKEENAAPIIQICYHLDGIPLAIELAAARIQLLRVEEIATHLDDRFHLLSSGSRTSLPRHRTLQALIDWSYDLLTEIERILFRRLSIFAGGWTLEAAENVCADDDDNVHVAEILDLLASLANKSLIIVEREQGKGTHYSMLETIRQYAHEKLMTAGEDEQMRQRHLDYFLDLAERGNKQIHGPDQVEWMDRLEREVDNYRAALDWCLSKQNTEYALRLLDALIWTWDWRGYFSEIKNRFEQVRVLPDVSDYCAPYASLLNHIGNESYFTGNTHYAQSVLKESQEIWLKLGLEGEQGLARALDILGQISLYDDGDTIKVKSLFERSFELYQKHEDEQGMAWLTFQFGNLADVQGNYDEAEGLYMKSLAKFREFGDKSRIALVLSGLGEMARATDDFVRAGKYWGQNLEIFQELRARFILAYPYIALGWVSLHTGDLEKARNLFRDGLILSNESSNDMNIALSIIGIAGFLGLTGKSEQAARLLGAADSILEGLSHMEPADQKDFDYYLSVVRKQLKKSAFEKAWSEGQSMTMEQAIKYALEQTSE